MLYRIKQFFKGLTAHSIDYSIVYKHLNHQERVLFDRLPLHEKRHAVDTASTILKIYRGSEQDILVKAGLLHDIGKIQDNIGIIKKSVLVLMDKFLPEISHQLSQKVKMFKTYYCHPEIGAVYLEEAGTNEKVILLVRYHHSEINDDIYNMDILKKADCMN